MIGHITGIDYSDISKLKINELSRQLRLNKNIHYTLDNGFNLIKEIDSVKRSHIFTSSLVYCFHHVKRHTDSNIHKETLRFIADYWDPESVLLCVGKRNIMEIIEPTKEIVEFNHHEPHGFFPRHIAELLLTNNNSHITYEFERNLIGKNYRNGIKLAAIYPDL